MTDPESIAPDVLQNLLHSDLEIRKKGLKQLKEQWTIEFREYLWKAIEKEKSKSFQAEMVDFALMTLKDRSLRKMIRFVEKDTLYPRARNHLITTYIEEETDIVREALIKSLKRARSQTYRFVCALLQDRFLSSEFNQKEIQELVADIFQDEIPNYQRKEMMVAVMNRYFTERLFQNMVRPVIWDILKEHPYLYYVVLRVYFNPDDDLDLEVVKPRQSPQLIWQRWNWIIPGKNQDFNEYQDLMGYTEQLVLEARHVESTMVRQEFIRVIAHQQISSRPSAVETDAYLDNLFQVWNQVVKHDLELILKQLDKVTGENLEQVFSEPLDGEDGPTLYEMMQIHQINPHDLIARVIAFLPRTLLFSCARADTDIQTRTLAITELDHEGFFVYTSNNGTTSLWGPPQFWNEIIEYTVDSISDNLSTSFYNTATALVYSIVDYLTDHPDSHVTEGVKTKLQRFEPKIRELEEYDRGLPILFRLLDFMYSAEYVIPSDSALTDRQKQLLLDGLLENIDRQTAHKSIINLIDGASFDVLIYIWELVSNLIEDLDQVTEPAEQEHLASVIKALIKCDDVRIRTKSHLLKNRFIKRWSDNKWLK